MVCLDSYIIINFLRKEDKAVMLMSSLKEKNYTFMTTTINSFELWKGAYHSKKENAVKSIERFLSEIEILSFNNRESRKAAEIFNFLRRKGEMVDELDIMIASIAIVNNESILTNNKKHFERILGVKFFDMSELEKDP